MSTYILKPISTTSWILQKDSAALTLIIKKKDQLISIGKLEKSIFDSIDDLEKFLGHKVEIQKSEEDSVDELGNIDQYPVKHTSAIQVNHDNLPVYKRTETSTTLYSAGYYGVKFPNGWVTSYCPKLSTLKENEYIGPFYTKLEMQNSISQKKKEIEI